jgi:hypothetical protein
MNETYLFSDIDIKLNKLASKLIIANSNLQTIVQLDGSLLLFWGSVFQRNGLEIVVIKK